MIDYITLFNVNGVAGNYTGKNASGAGAVDGTPFVASFIDDLWGRFQDLMSRAGLSANGLTEAVGSSQHIEALRKGFALGAGYTVMYNKAGTPVANGDRVLLLTGQGILRANYTELDAAVYVGDANNTTVQAGGGAFYRADDVAGTLPNIAGIYLILPDMRGVVPRGLDLAASIDPLGASRFLGDFQDDAFQGHNKTMYAVTATALTTNPTGASLAFVTGADFVYKAVAPDTAMASNTVQNYSTDGGYGIPRPSSESRGANNSTNFAITY